MQFYGSCAERGSVTVFSVLAFTGIALLCVIALGLAGLFMQKAALDNDLEVARESTLESGFQMQVKNAEDPGMLIAQQLCDSLRANGCQGELTVQFYEATDQELMAAGITAKDALKVRALAYQVIATQQTVKVSSLPELDRIGVSSGIACTMCPYSAYRTYRPGADADAPNYHAGTLYSYTSTAAGELVRGDLPTSAMTAGMAQAVKLACTKAAAVSID